MFARSGRSRELVTGSPLLPARFPLLGFIFVAGLVVVGVVGFMLLEHESLVDAALTTVSAISTVGYSPPRPLHTAGKLLAIVLILGGLVGIALVISTLTEYFVEGHLYGAWERRRVERAIDRLRDHYIICGFGRVGQTVARSLTNVNASFVVLDPNPETIAAARALNYLCLSDDATHDQVLQRVRVLDARALIACADSDTQNVYVTLTARALNPQLLIVARAAFEDARPKLLKAGASHVVSPYIMAGQHMAQLAANPAVADYVDLLFDGSHVGVRIQELRIDGGSPYIGRTIKDLHRTLLQGAFVLSIHRGEERIDDVGPEVLVQPGDRLLVVGSGEELPRLATIE